MQEELEALLSKHWILKSEERELYYRIRDNSQEIRKFVTERLGCPMVENQLLVKVERIPAVPKPFMGIQAFRSPREYALFCMLLMFLEEHAEDQFILSQLTEFIAGNLPGGGVDWTSYQERRRLVRVLQYAEEQGILKRTDGSEDGFVEAQKDVLYENTGVSMYYMRSFSEDIMDYTGIDDFLNSGWYEVDEDKGLVRRHRVYRRLLFSPGLYRSEGAEGDYEYLKNQGARMREELSRLLDLRLDISKGGGMLLLGENSSLGERFPGSNTVSDILLLCLGGIQQRIRDGVWKPDVRDNVLLEEPELDALLREVREANLKYFSKQYREQPEGDFLREVKEQLLLWTFLSRDADSGRLRIEPLCAKLAGRYGE